MVKKIIFILIFILFLPILFKQLALLESILDTQQTIANNFSNTAKTLKEVKIKVKDFSSMQGKISEANNFISKLITQAGKSNSALKQSIVLQNKTHQRLFNLDREIIKLNNNLQAAKNKLSVGAKSIKDSEKNFDESGKKLLTLESSLKKTSKIVREINTKIPSGE